MVWYGWRVDGWVIGQRCRGWRIGGDPFHPRTSLSAGATFPGNRVAAFLDNWAGESLSAGRTRLIPPVEVERQALGKFSAGFRRPFWRSGVDLVCLFSVRDDAPSILGRKTRRFPDEMIVDECCTRTEHQPPPAG